MSKGGGSTNTVSQTQLSPEQSAIMQSNYQSGMATADRPYQAYGGQLVANLNGDQTDLFSRIRALQGTGAQQIGQAQNIVSGVAGYTPQQVGTGQTAQQVGTQSLSGADLSGYINPYTQQVLGSALSDLDRQRVLAQNDNNAKAIAAGAFGGSQAAVRQGVTDAEAARAAGQLSAQINADAFTNAQTQFQTDQARALSAAQGNQSSDLQAQQLRLAAQQANQDAGLQGANLSLNAGNVLGQLAATGNQITSNELGLLDTAGQQQYQQNQNALNALYQQFLEQRDYPIQQQNIRNAAYAGQQFTPTQISTSNNGAGNTLGQVLGAGTSLAGIYSLLSDARMKKNKQKLGKDPATGVDIYAYDYKSDTKSTGKRIGVMAQDVEKVRPDAVREIGGVKFIDQRKFNVGAAVDRASNVLDVIRRKAA